MGIQQDSRHKRRATGGKRATYRKHRKFRLGRQPALTKLGETRVRQIRVRGGGIKLRALRLDSGIFSWGSEGVSRKSRIINVVYNGANNEFVRTNTLVKGEIIKVDAAPFRLWYESYYGIPVGKKAEPKSGKAPAKGAKTAKAPKKDAPKKDAPKEGEAPAKDAAEAPKDADKAKAPAKEAAKAKAPAKDAAKAKAPAKDAAKAKAPAKAPAKGAKAAVKPVRRLSTRLSTKGSIKEGGLIRKTKSAKRAYAKRAAKRVIDPLFEEQFQGGFLLAAIASRPGQTGRVDGYLLEGKELEFYQKKTQKKKSQK